MKTLDALISVWWSLTALATLFVVLQRPHPPEAPPQPDVRATSCELPGGPVMLRVLTPERGER